MGARPQEIRDLADFWESRGDLVEAQRLRRSAAETEFAEELEREERAGATYDTEEVSVLVRMKRTLIEKHGWELEDFEDMSFLDIEAEFLEVEDDFRPKED